LLAARTVGHTTKAWAIPIDLASLLVECTLLASLLLQILRRSGNSTVLRFRYGSVCGGFTGLVCGVGGSGGNLLEIGVCIGLGLSLDSLTFCCYSIECGKSLGLNLCLRRGVSNIWMASVPMVAQLRNRWAYKKAPRRRHY